MSEEKETIIRDTNSIIAEACVSALMNEIWGYTQRHIHTTLERLSKTTAGRQAIKDQIRYYQQKINLLKEYDDE